MPDYLVVPQERRDRAVHEKARAARRGELRWLRSYLSDVLDAEDLFGEPLTVRFLDLALLHLAARSDWMVLLDSRAIAGRFGVRGRDVKPAIARLLELRRFELVYVGETTAQGVQPALFAPSTPGEKPGDNRAAATVQEPSRSHAGTVQKPRRSHPDVTRLADTTAQPSRGETLAASQRLPQRREEKRRTEDLASRTTLSAEDERLPADLLEQGWNTVQIAAAVREPDRARAWLDYASREPGLENLGGYTWARFSVPTTWPNGKRPPTLDERRQRLETFTISVLSQMHRTDAIEELDQRLQPIPATLRPTMRAELIDLLDRQEPDLP